MHGETPLHAHTGHSPVPAVHKHQGGSKSSNYPRSHHRAAAGAVSTASSAQHPGRELGGDALPRHQPPRQLEHGTGEELGPQGSGGARHSACSGLLPRGITQPAFSAAQGANRTDQLTARSFIHTFFKAASKTEQLLSGGARAQREMAPAPRYVSGMRAD